MSHTIRKPTWSSALSIFLFAVLFFIGTVFCISLFRKPYYYSDPTRTGYPSELERAMQAGLVSLPGYDKLMDETFVNFPDYEGFFDSIVVKTNETPWGNRPFRFPNPPSTPGVNKTDLRVEMRVTLDQYDYMDNSSLEYHHVDHDEVFESEEGRIWIDHIAVVYGDTPGEMPTKGNGVKLPARLFDMDFRELSEGEAKEAAPNEWNRVLTYYALFPSIGFMLKGQPIEEARLMAVQAFDARTHRFFPVMTSQIYPRTESLEEGYSLQIRFQQWHSAPLDIVVDVAFGPPVIVEFPAEAGQSRTIASGEIKLLAKAVNTHQTLTFATYDPTRPTTNVLLGGTLDNDPTFTGSKTTNTENDLTTLLAFAVVPEGNQFPLTIELLDDQGAVIPEDGRNRLFYDETFKNLQGTGGEIETILAKYYPNRKRLIFRLPRIPGLPEENYEVENLFDVKVPYARMYTSHNLRQLVEKSAQVQIKSPWNISEQTFSGPRDYQNITVKELVEEIANLSGPTYGAEINQENLTIEFLDMSLKARAERVWEDLKAKFD